VVIWNRRNSFLTRLWSVEWSRKKGETLAIQSTQIIHLPSLGITASH
jgi:hypothetical protein